MNCGSPDLVSEEVNNFPPMKQLGTIGLERSSLDAYEWDPEEFDSLDFVWPGPDEAPFDFNKADEPIGSNAQQHVLCDELLDPLRNEQDVRTLTEIFFHVEPPDMSSPTQAVRVAQFGLALTAIILLNVVVLLLNLV